MTIVVHPLIYHLMIFPVILCTAIVPFIALSEWMIHKFQIRYKEIPKIISYILAILSGLFLFSLYETYYPSKDHELFITSKNKTIEVKRDGMYLLTTDKDIINIIGYGVDSVLDFEFTLKDEITTKVSLSYSFKERNPVKVRTYYSDYYCDKEDKSVFFFLSSYFEEKLIEDIENLLQQTFSVKNIDEIDDIFISNLEEEILLMAKNKLNSEEIRIKLSIKDPS